MEPEPQAQVLVSVFRGGSPALKTPIAFAAAWAPGAADTVGDSLTHTLRSGRGHRPVLVAIGEGTAAKCS